MKTHIGEKYLKKGDFKMKGIFIMNKCLFFIIVVSVGMINYHCFADDNRFVSGDYIMIMDGGNSIYQAVKVKVNAVNSKLLLSIDRVEMPILTLDIMGNEIKNNGKGDEGDYTIVGKIVSNTEIKGDFDFKVSEKGAGKEYMDDKGAFLLIPYTQQKMTKYQESIDERLYRTDMHESLEEMAKRSPWARKQLKQGEVDRVSEEKHIVFYGKVVDQFGLPVTKAEIKYSITIFTLIMWSKDNVKDYDTKSDDNGLFTIKGYKGKDLNVDVITKNGYDKLIANKEFKYEYGQFIPNSEHPVVFHMRKKGENPTYLMMNQDFNFDMSSGENLVRSFIDLRNDWKEKHEDGNYDKDFLSKHYDIKVSATFDKEKSDWTVIFTASGKDSGFVLDDKFLSKAPEGGYMKEFTIIQHVATEKEREEYENSEDDSKMDKFQKLTEFKFKGKYLYIKSRNPAIYTRMELTDACADDSESVRIDANTATNPYGERNLELCDELPLNVGDVLYGSVIDSFLANKRPEKPDINKMFDEFKKTHKPEKNTYGNTIWVEIKK